ncbi:DUF6036 family nucleotidyltransferase [Actinotalea sp. C106]|uniref:DUF6036 family nucleotidyltransferase n=1 Tax=Actinotalea sp. C106 TaxID=2908644 RepID=UPI0020280B71|nr:DUF6036 family nucleotidyltransferase [Actinotalea sp. C106]
MSPLFERDDLVDGLTELATALADDGVSATLRVVGGAALALHHMDRGVTADIDALLYGDGEAVRHHVTRIARTRGWPEDWLNDAVKAYLPLSGDPEWIQILVRDDVRVFVAPADMLLAMKLNAARGRRDSTDIAHLLDACSIRSVEAAEALFERYYPGEAMKERALADLTSRFTREN